MTTHKHRMLYQTYRDLGLHIGSGVIEAGCKTVVQSPHIRRSRDAVEFTRCGVDASLMRSLAQFGTDRIR